MKAKTLNLDIGHRVNNLINIAKGQSIIFCSLDHPTIIHPDIEEYLRWQQIRDKEEQTMPQSSAEQYFPLNRYLKVETVTEPLIYKVNNLYPYPYSEGLKNDEVIVVLSSRFSDRVGFSRQLDESQMKKFIELYIKGEIEYRKEYAEFVAKHQDYDLTPITPINSEICVVTATGKNSPSSTKYLKTFSRLLQDSIKAHKDASIECLNTYSWPNACDTAHKIYFDPPKRYLVADDQFPSAALEHEVYTPAMLTGESPDTTCGGCNIY